MFLIFLPHLYGCAEPTSSVPDYTPIGKKRLSKSLSVGNNVAFILGIDFLGTLNGIVWQVCALKT